MNINIEAAEHQQQILLSRTSSRCPVSIGCDRGMLRIQFSSELSRRMWHKKQNYLYLGLKDTPENSLVAQFICREIELDISDGNFDRSLEKYEAYAKEHKQKSLEKLEPKANPIQEFITKTFQGKTLSVLFDLYCDYKRPILAETTLLTVYRTRYARAFKKCPQNLSDGLKIRQHLLDQHSSGEAKRLLGIIATMVDWAKVNNLLSPQFLNVYRQYSQDIKPTGSRETATSIQELIDAGVIDYPEPEIRAFTPEEVKAIIEAFEEREFLNNRSGTPWDYVIKFLFWTGCRHGECAGLWWNDISTDCSKINFRFSYDYTTKIHKGLKTERYAVKSRIFPCGPKLQNLLLSIRPDNFAPSSYVFTNRTGKPINFGTFHMYWAGTSNRKYKYPGVLVDLIKEGKVKQYLTPYATRHTYINIQLNAGMKPIDVAKLVGNSPATIHRYYESISREPINPIEV